jgi:hypothetical protein
MDVVVTCSDKYLWALKPFSILFNKYWSHDQRVIVAGYKFPDFDLPRNFMFYSISSEQYPKEKWVDGMQQFLDVYRSPYFVLLLEDYWLTRKADVEGVHYMMEYMQTRPNILRVDLTADRLYAGGVKQVDYYHRFDIIEAPRSEYQMSLQAGIWNRELLLKVFDNLPAHMHSAWDVEIEGTIYVNRIHPDMRVVGTRQYPVRYANGMNNASGKRVFFDGMNQDDITLINDTIPSEYKQE